MLLQWRGSKVVPFLAYAELRNRFNLDKKQYSTMSNFKRVVLDPAIRQINEHTDIIVTYEQVKEGRNITGFIFRFELKQKAKAKAKPAAVTAIKSKVALIWGTTEIRLFKQLHAKCADLTKIYIENLARVGDNTLSFVLNDMLMKNKDVEFFEIMVLKH